MRRAVPDYVVCVTARVCDTHAACGMRESGATAVDSCGCGRQRVSNTADDLMFSRSPHLQILGNSHPGLDYEFSQRELFTTLYLARSVSRSAAICTRSISMVKSFGRVAESRAERGLSQSACLTASRKPTGAAETVHEFYIGPWTKVRPDPVWSRCSATPGPRQVYIVSRAAVRIPTCLLCGPYPLAHAP